MRDEALIRKIKNGYVVKTQGLTYENEEHAFHHFVHVIEHLKEYFDEET